MGWSSAGLVLRWLLAIVALGCAPWAVAGAAASAARQHPSPTPLRTSACTAWPAWQAFAQQFIQADGRVIDFSTPQQPSTSEGQSYAMFFALAANDRARFDQLWRWSVNNLAAGDVAAQLPAWQWGQRPDGTWGVLDTNSASDADVWLAYSLLEAARVWHAPDYARDAQHLLRLIARDAVVTVPGLGPTLLPGARGFVHIQGDQQQWRLNPSYSFVPLWRRLAQADPTGPWKALITSGMQVLQASTPLGYVPDWMAYQAPLDGRSGRFIVDPVAGDVGSYDSIRVYLWAGMTSGEDPLRAAMLARVYGMTALLQQRATLPEKIATRSGALDGKASVGMSAALVPLARQLPTPSAYQGLLQATRAALQAAPIHASTPAPDPAPVAQVYYDWVLGLFATGWAQHQFQFLPSGMAQFCWETTCPCDTGVR